MAGTRCGKWTDGGGVLPGEEVIPELAFLVYAVEPQRLGKILDAAAYLRILLRPRLWRRWNRHPRTVQVPAMRESDIVVVDAMVGRPELRALLEQHVVAVALPRGACLDAHCPRHIIL
jgi:hypothetical protein